MRRKWHAHVGRESSSGDVLHLVDPLLLASLVLKPDLDHPHGQPGVLGQLFANLTRWFGILIKTCF